MIKRQQYIGRMYFRLYSVKQRSGGELFFPQALQYGSCWGRGCCFSVLVLVLGFVVWGAWLNCIVTALEDKKRTQVRGGQRIL